MFSFRENVLYSEKAPDKVRLMDIQLCHPLLYARARAAVDASESRFNFMDPFQTSHVLDLGF